MNSITSANVFVANQLFATLDPTTRKVKLPEGHFCLFTDTVGFIQKLPTQLVVAFRATLEEISEADLLLNIVDISHPGAQAQWESVISTLTDLNASEIPMITVLNKIDKISEKEIIQIDQEHESETFSISALKRKGIEKLLE